MWPLEQIDRRGARSAETTLLYGSSAKFVHPGSPAANADCREQALNKLFWIVSKVLKVVLRVIYRANEEAVVALRFSIFVSLVLPVMRVEDSDVDFSLVPVGFGPL